MGNRVKDALIYEDTIVFSNSISVPTYVDAARLIHLITPKVSLAVFDERPQSQANGES